MVENNECTVGEGDGALRTAYYVRRTTYDVSDVRRTATRREATRWLAGHATDLDARQYGVLRTGYGDPRESSGSCRPVRRAITAGVRGRRYRGMWSRPLRARPASRRPASP